MNNFYNHEIWHAGFWSIGPLGILPLNDWKTVTAQFDSMGGFVRVFFIFMRRYIT
jgi:hypothetical protein